MEREFARDPEAYLAALRRETALVLSPEQEAYTRDSLRVVILSSAARAAADALLPPEVMQKKDHLRELARISGEVLQESLALKREIPGTPD